MSQKIEKDVIEKHKKVAYYLASVSLFTQYPTLLDRLANALSIDAVQKVIYEVGRIFVSIKSSEEQYIKEITKEKEGKTHHYIEITVKSSGEQTKKYLIHGRLAGDKDIEEFLKDSIENVRVARIIAAYAMNIYASALKGEER